MSYSVIIPTFERLNWLIECVNSIINQEVRPGEIIVIDDGSSCGVEKQQYLEKISQVSDIDIIFKINERNLGACRSRNIGARLSRFDKIAFLDDDDLWHVSKAAKQLPKLKKGFDIICSNAFILSEAEVVGETNYELKSNIKKQILTENFISSPTNLINKYLFLRVGGFDSKFPALQDRDLWTNMILNGAKVYLHADNLAFHRLHGEPSIGKSEYTKIAYSEYLKKYKFDLVKNFAVKGAAHLVINAFSKI